MEYQNDTFVPSNETNRIKDRNLLDSYTNLEINFPSLAASYRCSTDKNLSKILHLRAKTQDPVSQPVTSANPTHM